MRYPAFYSLIMIRDDLLRRLEDLKPMTPAACLVLLWTYFEDDRVGLSSVEDLVRARWRYAVLLPEHDQIHGPARALLAAALEDLRSQSDSGEFDLLALRWLKGLDRLLNEGNPQDFEIGRFTGFDGRPYAVRGRNAFLANHFEKTGHQVRWAAHQGLSLAAYCRHFMVVPGEVQGIRIRAVSAWGSSHLQDRLYAERESLRIMLWPLQTPPDYPGLDALNAKVPPDRIVLDEIRNEPELQEEIAAAVRVARQERVTLLIFPELAVPPATEERIRRDLARHGVDGHPVLTLFGCCHRPSSQGNLHLNEAVLLGPDGSEIHRHRKLAPFTDYRFGEAHPVGEVLETGKAFTVLESAIGNLAPLICIDLLNDEVKEVVRRSHGNLFPVPSFSKETKAHRHAAITLQVRARAGTFVCNRWTTPLSKDTTSFYRIPRQDGLILHWPSSDGVSYLLFAL
jgi:hypothetical protein